MFLRLAIILALTGFPFATASSSSTADNVGVTPPYAIIDWESPRNPEFVALGEDAFLVHLRAGVQVWDARKKAFSDARQWPAGMNVRHSWAELDKGRIVVGADRAKPDAAADALIWWNREARTFSAPLALPTGTLVHDIVAINAHTALACLRVGYAKNTDYSTLPTRAVLLGLDKGQPRLVTDNSAAMRAALLGAGIHGSVEGAGQLADDDGTPLFFNTQSCKWEIRHGPEELLEATDLTIKHHRLPDDRLLIAHADWYSPKRGSRANLAAPYLWNPKVAAWQRIAVTADDGTGGYIFNSYGMNDPVVSVSAVHPRFIEFLDPAGMRWIRSEQRLPLDSYSPIVAPFGSNAALAILREHGHVQLLTPMTAPPAGQFAYPHSYMGEVPLAGGGLLLANSGDRWHPANRPEMLRTSPTPASKPIAPMPTALGFLAGVELNDKTILVFGGLPARCGPTMLTHECKGMAAPPSYRYFPQQDKWEEVPGLTLRFANGMPWDYGNSDITTQWSRRDAIVRRNGDFVYIDGPAHYEIDEHDMTPIVSSLVRWRAGSPPVKLARLQAPRSFASLLELKDQRLVALGGEVAEPLKSETQDCDGCDDIAPSSRQFDAALTTEVFDDAKGKWMPGPVANYGGGQAYKLENGKIFKLATAERWSAEKGYLAEIADAAFTQWKKLPPFPLKQVRVSHVSVAGDRVLILLEDPARKIVIWDDRANAWRVWDQGSKEMPISITAIDGQRGIARRWQNYEIITFPK